MENKTVNQTFNITGDNTQNNFASEGSTIFAKQEIVSKNDDVIPLFKFFIEKIKEIETENKNDQIYIARIFKLEKSMTSLFFIKPHVKLLLHIRTNIWANYPIEVK